MRVLFVTPVEIGSGETITALHMAEEIVKKGGKVIFLASPFAARIVGARFPDDVRRFTGNIRRNLALWESSLRGFRPDIVLFSDYPLLFFSSGVSPLAADDEWRSSLEEVDASLVTLDHTLFAQREMGLFFGPPHISFHYETFPEIPERMQILLPCPMNEPLEQEWRKGYPFRYWEVPLSGPDRRSREMRLRYLEREDDYLVFHSVAPWSWQSAQGYGLPHYTFLPEILEYYLADLPKPVTVVSVNNGELLKPRRELHIRIVNLSSLPKDEYENLLFNSDLMITDNRISITLGKAVCGFVPCAVLKNSWRFRELLQRLPEKLREMVKEMEDMRRGAVFPYDIFPNGMGKELDQLGLYRNNSITGGFRTLEIFGGEETRRELEGLLSEETVRDVVRDRQEVYMRRVKALDGTMDILQKISGSGRNA